MFVRTGDDDLLVGVLLALTGCVAMFAKYAEPCFPASSCLTQRSLDQFNRASIQLFFEAAAYPSLILAYLEQGACLIHDGESVLANAF